MIPNKTTVLAFLLISAWVGIALGVHAADWPGKKSNFHGYAQYDFPLEDFSCRVVVPAKPAPGNQWIWRARFWAHMPNVDLALLERGFHVAYADVSNLFGSPLTIFQ